LLRRLLRNEALLASREAIPSLTGLRFLAAFSVVLSHALQKLVPIPQTPGYAQSVYVLAMSASGFGMPLFFVLSGFVIQYNYSAQIRTGGSSEIRKFFFARFARLYPLYILAIACSVLVERGGTLGAVPYFALMIQSWVYVPFGDNQLIYSLGPTASVAWSVSTEWFFYCAFPFLCLMIAALKTRRARVIAAISLCIAALALVSLAIANLDKIDAFARSRYGTIGGGGPYGQDSFFRWLVYFSPYSRIFEFILGCMVAEIYINRSSTPNQTLGKLLTAASVVMIATSYFAFFGLDRIPWFHTIGILHMSFGLAPGIGLLIYCCACYDNALVRLLASSWLVLWGEASYSLYLLHIVIVDNFPRGEAIASRYHDLMSLFICLAACVGLSIISWRSIEVPARQSIRKFLMKTC
jgi:peptidoglycan/LPS O-acetylase OafA/YrhL